MYGRVIIVSVDKIIDGHETVIFFIQINLYLTLFSLIYLLGQSAWTVFSVGSFDHISQSMHLIALFQIIS